MDHFCFTRLPPVMALLIMFLSGTASARSGEPILELTNVAQLHQLGPAPVGCHVALAGDVWWINPTGDTFVLHDASGTAALQALWQGPSVQPGDRVRLAGTILVGPTGGSYRFGTPGPVVDNNGVHDLIEKSGAVFLTAGRHPLRVAWFNGVEKYGLTVEYEGPNLPRQRIPDAALFRPGQGPDDWAAGLNYSCYEAAGEVLPDFDELAPLKSGTVSNFDLGVMTRPEHVALQFTGFLQVPADGLYVFYTTSDDGSQLYVGNPPLRLERSGRTHFPEPRRLAPGQLWDSDGDCQWVTTEGNITFVGASTNGLNLELGSDTGRMRVVIADPHGLAPAALLNSHLRATGVCESALTTDGQRIAGLLLVSGAAQVEWSAARRHQSADASTNETSLRTLTAASDVHRLKREDAQRGYPVRLRGVVTSVLPEHQAFTIQDATRGLYVVDLSAQGTLPQIGDFLEITGVTDPSLFAPIVNAHQRQVLGAGNLPAPARPTWDQLMNGSLDAQYVELQGIVLANNTNTLMLLTREGRIKLELRLAGAPAEAPARCEDALVRIRGCLFASWDYVTHEVKAGEIRIYGADLSVDEPAPADLFALPAKSAADLLLFNPQASVFQRVRVTGQILHARGAEFIMTDGHSGLRFITKKPVDLAPGDLVEVVGFPELSGASPVLHEAVARKTGAAPLPSPPLLADDLVRADHDATRVRVTGILAGVRETPTETVLEIQNGVRTFLARLDAEPRPAGWPPTGAKLELTGVYAAQGGNKATGQDISSFELLLNSPADLRVLVRPPWWTLGRLLVILGALACVLAVTVLWITQLHRKVEARSAELEVQIHERQRVDHLRALEQERARIAQDLHDELGSGLTEISMLGVRARAALISDDKREHYLEQMSGKAREMVVALDEIVWAMNPRHNSLASLVSYFSLYADRFLGLAGIGWRLDDSSAPSELAVDSRIRHQLFLAFKEALTNAVRHSGATEVRLGISLAEGEVRFALADNGRGLPASQRTEEMDGVANMRVRLEKIGGRFEIDANDAGHGTTVRFFIPTK